jgi:hypothetical protein
MKESFGGIRRSGDIKTFKGQKIYSPQQKAFQNSFSDS